MRLWLRRLGGLVLAFFALYALAWWTATPDMGQRPEGARLAAMRASPQWRGEGFDNPLPRLGGPALELLRRQLFTGEAVQVPTAPLPVEQRAAEDFASPPASGLRVTWLGHSTLLIEQDGARLLVDPVWGPRASPWTSIGPARFAPPPLALADLPPLDAVLISHDHYDHLDLHTVRALLAEPGQGPGLRWLVPLGVGAHLEAWGVDPARITELDWWQAAEVAGLTVTATPARHFSGRWLDRFTSTLWVGWALAGPEHRVFYSGDTSLFPELIDIGERLGPFHLTLLDAGAYDATWTDVHLGPEQTVIAHRMLRGEVLVPVHWGLFDLANHGWTDPVERVRAAAARFGVELRTPRPGGSIELDQPAPAPWWPALPTQTVETDPIWSSHVEELLDAWWGPARPQAGG